MSARKVCHADTYLKSLSARMLVLVLFSILIFSLVLASLLLFGSERIFDSWKDSETNALHDYIEGNLLEVAKKARQTGMQVTSTDIELALKGMPFSPSWIVVTDAEGKILYYYRKGDGAGLAKNFLQNVQNDKNEWVDVSLSDGTKVFRYSSLIPAFNELDSNRILVSAAKQLLLWGSVLAALIAFVLAFFFSRPLKKQTSVLVSSLERMAKGDREVVIPPCPVAEFDQIAGAFTILQANLKQEELLRRQWAADIAHDLRTPITVVRGQLEGMLDGVFVPDTLRLTRLLNENIKLGGLVQSLALLTKIETPGFSPNKKEIPLAPFFDKVASQFDLKTEAEGFSLNLAIPPVSLVVDPVLFERVIDNLISNALCYGKKGEIGIFVTSRDREGTPIPLSLIIENEGTIDSKILSRIFDRMYRGDSARETKGSGLGLSIVQAIVKAHGWSIGVESDERNKKTRFIVSFA
jgi:two-component system sensor histidine kinase BaeS